MKNLIYFLAFFSLCSCDPHDSRLTIVNKTTFPINYDFKFNKSDTVFDNFNVYINDAIAIGDSSRQSILGTDTWLRKLKQSENKQLSLFFYNIDSLKINMHKFNNMQTYFLAKKYFKVFKLNEKQLDSCNWVIRVTE